MRERSCNCDGEPARNLRAGDKRKKLKSEERKFERIAGLKRITNTRKGGYLDHQGGKSGKGCW